MRWTALRALLGLILFGGLSSGAAAQGTGGPCIVGSTTVLGCFKVDGTTISVNGSGVISSLGGAATSIVIGTTTVGGGTTGRVLFDNAGVLGEKAVTGTGSVVLAAAPTITGVAVFSGVPQFAGLSAGTQVSCLGLDSGNNLVLNAAACGSGGGGSTAFSALTGSTNTTAAMVVGTGASLGVSGSGTITATAAPASGLTGSTLAAGVTASSLTSVGTLTGLTMGGTLALGTNTVSGGFTVNGVLLLTGLSSGTQVSCLGLDSGNHIVLALAACGTGGSSSGVGVAGGESISTINNTSSTLAAAHYIVQTVTAQFSAARTTTLPTASAFGAHIMHLYDSYISGVGCAVNGTNIWNIKPNGTDTINGVTGTSGQVVLNVPCSGLDLFSDGTSNWTPQGTFPGGTSGGIPYYSAVGQISSSGLLTANGLMIGGGAGATPATIAAMTDGQLPVGQTSAAPIGKTVSGDCTMAASGAITCTKTNGTSLTALATTAPGSNVATALTATLSAAGGLTSTIASGTSAMGTGAISSATCATVVTTSAPNTATTDVVLASFNGDPTAVTGYIPATAGMLTIISYPTSGNVNFKVCNNTTSSITPGALTLNWRVLR